MAVVGTNDWKAVAYGNGRYVAIGYVSNDVSERFITRSTNGITWSTPEKFGYRVDRMMFANGRFIATNNASQIITSSDGGYTWTATSISVPSGTGTFYVADVAYGNDIFVAVSRESGYTTTSTDGVIWSTPSRNGTNYASMRTVIFGDGKFVAVSHNSAHISLDGQSWTTTNVSEFKLPSNMGPTWNAGAYGNGKYVVVGYEGMSGYISVSTDGEHWTVPKSSYGVSWYDVTYTKGIFITCGSSGYISTSKDGANWTAKENIKDEYGNIVTNFFYGIAYAQ